MPAPTFDIPLYPATEHGVSRALRALGTTPARVADRLLRLGCFGPRGDCSRCPVAVYLLDVISDVTGVWVDAASVTVHPRLAGPVEAELPLAVQEFIDGFDHRDFANLSTDLADVFPTRARGLRTGRDSYADC